jgi:glutamyl-tRNA reductase
MRQRPDETYAQWVERVREFELDYAQKQIRKGSDVNLVMEAMSARIMQKLIHPLLVAVKEGSRSEYSAEENRIKYFEAMRGHKPAADHIEEEKIDKSE